MPCLLHITSSLPFTNHSSPGNSPNHITTTVTMKIAFFSTLLLACTTFALPVPQQIHSRLEKLLLIR